MVAVSRHFEFAGCFGHELLPSHAISNGFYIGSLAVICQFGLNASGTIALFAGVKCGLDFPIPVITFQLSFTKLGAGVTPCIIPTTRDLEHNSHTLYREAMLVLKHECKPVHF